MKRVQNKNALVSTNKSRVSRRDFGRAAVLGAIAATIAGRASGDPHPLKIDHSHYVGRPCHNFLQYLIDHQPGITAGALLDMDLKHLVDDLGTKFEDKHGDTSVTDSVRYMLLGSAANSLSAAVDKANSEINDPAEQNIMLKDLYLYGWETDIPKIEKPRPNVTQSTWYDVFSHCRAEHNGISLPQYLSMPFLDIPPGSNIQHDHWRPMVKSLINSSDFSTAARLYSYTDLFTRNILEVFGQEGNSNNVEHKSDYLYIRRAFRLGIFRNAKPSNSASLFDNDKCWSVSQGQCIYLESSDYYCATDANNIPTASTDICN